MRIKRKEGKAKSSKEEESFVRTTTLAVVKLPHKSCVNGPNSWPPVKLLHLLFLPAIVFNQTHGYFKADHKQLQLSFNDQSLQLDLRLD